MTPPEDLMRRMLLNASATDVARTLQALGYTVNESQCNTMRSVLLAKGEAQLLPPCRDRHAVVRDPVSRAATASDNLLRAQLRTGLHWITDPNRFAEACASVGLVAA